MKTFLLVDYIGTRTLLLTVQCTKKVHNESVVLILYSARICKTEFVNVKHSQKCFLTLFTNSWFRLWTSEREREEFIFMYFKYIYAITSTKWILTVYSLNYSNWNANLILPRLKIPYKSTNISQHMNQLIS